MKKAFVLLFLITTYAIAEQPKAFEDNKVFGIELGAPLQFQECPKHKLLKDYWPYDIVPSQRCWQHLDRPRSGAPVPIAESELIKISFPINDLPEAASSVMARVINGKVEGISFSTSGTSDQDYVFRILARKYGEPTAKQVHDIQNGFGAKFVKIEALWTFTNIYVEFEGVSHQLDMGQVRIGTPAMKAAAERAKVSSGTPL